MIFVISVVAPIVLMLWVDWFVLWFARFPVCPVPSLPIGLWFVFFLVRFVTARGWVMMLVGWVMMLVRWFVWFCFSDFGWLHCDWLPSVICDFLWYCELPLLGIIFVHHVWCLSTALVPFVVKWCPYRRSRRLQSLHRKVDYFPSRTRYIRAPHTVLSLASSIGSTEVINCTTTFTLFERNFINFYLTCGNIYF